MPPNSPDNSSIGFPLTVLIFMLQTSVLYTLRSGEFFARNFTGLVGNIKPVASGFDRNELVKTSVRTSLFCIIRTLFLLPICKKVVLKYPPFVFTFFILGGMFCFLCKKRRLKSFSEVFGVTVQFAESRVYIF